MLTLFLAPFLFILTAGAEVPDPPQAGRMRTDAHLRYFTSNANFGEGGGSSVDLPNGAELKNGVIDGVFNYDFNSSLRVFGGARGGWINTSDGFIERDASGLTDVLAGGQYWMQIRRLRLVGQGDFSFPTLRVDEGSDEALVGEGAMSLRAGGWLIYPSGSWDPFVYLGVDYRDDGRSSLIPYAAGTKFTNETWWLQLEMRGYQSVTDDDAASDRILRNAYLTRIQGGSYRYYAVNPSAHEVAFEAGLDLGAVLFSGGVAKTVLGENTADGLTFMIGLSFVPGGTDYRQERFGSNDEDFELDTGPIEDVDLFQNEDPRTTPGQKRRARQRARIEREMSAPVSSGPSPTVTLRKKPRTRKPLKTKIRKNPQTERMMREIEKELEEIP